MTVIMEELLQLVRHDLVAGGRVKYSGDLILDPMMVSQMRMAIFEETRRIVGSMQSRIKYRDC